MGTAAPLAAHTAPAGIEPRAVNAVFQHCRELAGLRIKATFVEVGEAVSPEAVTFQAVSPEAVSPASPETVTFHGLSLRLCMRSQWKLSYRDETLSCSIR